MGCLFERNQLGMAQWVSMFFTLIASSTDALTSAVEDYGTHRHFSLTANLFSSMQQSFHPCLPSLV
tara:strand:- start:620 stop:817 length:198 start_codon:yes stop_codon:yes gene_type:complete